MRSALANSDMDTIGPPGSDGRGDDQDHTAARTRGKGPTAHGTTGPTSARSVGPRNPVVDRHVADRHSAARCRLIAGRGALAYAVGETAIDGEIEDDRVAVVDRCRPGRFVHLVLVHLEELTPVDVPADLLGACIGSIRRLASSPGRRPDWAGGWRRSPPSRLPPEPRNRC
jgi:hypothetical protein